ncbi:putative monovalent cation/H+ antiporter 3 subunit C [Thermococcus cleftensis]|uniref:Monovalent cation/H+ antiporter 3 subunit C n=1 Tax=Thermococcus cleftensis (strain DSM 27260 / KACC 17922 / CL1) TaxID=163003 RepID=I3ZV94_THECF|nr:cation:proton antiporter subunit C [Thermococcus cleftensis]AFL95628.1 putative monovalent cation/H+ antiporter 3 subunit C [Thermococcus cleftensis]NJE04413.1 cation:proton antiporter [Thermococcus sp. MV11]
MISPEQAGIAIMLVGIYGLMAKREPIKLVLSINVVSLGLVLFFIGLAYSPGRDVPVMPAEPVDPLPATLMLTTLVVDVAITSLALAMIIRMRGEGN